MKTRLIRLLQVVLMLAAVACSKAEPDKPVEPVLPDQPVLPEYCDFKFNMGGEFTTTVSYDSLTKSQTGDLYAVIIHEDKEDGEIFSGIFDDPSKMQLKLKKASKYYVTATVIKKGEEKLAKEDGCYKAPFKESGAQVTNAFISGYNACSMDYIIKSDAYAISKYTDQGPLFRRPPIDRYFGKCKIEDPSNGSATVVLKRVSFGVEYEVIGDMADRGAVLIMMEDAPGLLLDLATANKISEIFTLADDDFQSILESETVRFDFVYVPAKDDIGEQDRYGNIMSFEVKRNKKAKVTILLNSLMKSNSIAVQYTDGETGDMEDGGGAVVQL